MSNTSPAPAPLAPTAPPAVRERLQSVDLVRGLIMVVMALDHTRDMFSSAPFGPMDLARTNAAYFFTRLVTHLCAPGFILLAGAGAFLSRKPQRPLSRFLFTRGLWLVLVEITLVKLAWTFNLVPVMTPLQVIWAIGWSMVALAALVYLPLPAIGILGVALMLGHDLFDGIRVGPLITGLGAGGAFVGTGRDWAISILHESNPPVFYPLVPWIGVMAAGFALGPVFFQERARRRRFLLLLGLALCAAFVLVRALNGYGDPAPWTSQPRPFFTFLSFLRVSKYPPSLDYLLMTLGPVLLLLAAAERLRGPLAAALVVFGRVPFFFYVLHLYLLHLAAIAVGAVTGIPPGAFTHAMFLEAPPGFGFGLPGVYLAWALVVLSLYPACRWFARVKATRRDWWISYL